jgi:hypothetical protein
MRRFALVFSLVATLIHGLAGAGVAQDGQAELSKAAQNPVGDLISLPFQNNTNFGLGPMEGTQNVLNVQPVWR